MGKSYDTGTKPPVYENASVLSNLASQAVGLVRRAGQAAVSAILPDSGPAGKATTVAINAAGKGAEVVGKATAGAINSAASGVKIGIIAVIVLVSLYFLAPILGLFRKSE